MKFIVIKIFNGLYDLTRCSQTRVADILYTKI